MQPKYASLKYNKTAIKRDAEMAIFNTEYIPEIEWIMIKPCSKMDIDMDKNINRCTKCKSQNSDSIPDHRHNVFQPILQLIKLIETMIQYNNMYYQRIEIRRQQQNLELQVLTMLLQNICNNLKNI